MKKKKEMMHHKKRYQECSKLEKFWRRRWYLAVPFLALYHYLFDKIYNPTHDVFSKASYKEWYHITRGEVEFFMNYFYTEEEMNKKIEEMFD